MEIQVGDEDVNKVHDLAMEMIPGLTMKDKFQGRYPRTDSLFIEEATDCPWIPIQRFYQIYCCS